VSFIIYTSFQLLLVPLSLESYMLCRSCRVCNWIPLPEIA